MRYLVYFLDNEVGAFTCDDKEFGFKVWLQFNNVKNASGYHVVAA